MNEIIKHTKFNIYVQDILNHEFSIGLLPNLKIKGTNSKIVFDFADIEKGIFVEIIQNYRSLDRPNIIERINHQRHLVQNSHKYKKFTHVLVFGDSISIKDRNYYNENLQNTNIIQQHIFDFKDISKLAEMHGIVYEPDLTNEESRIHDSSSDSDKNEIPNIPTNIKVSVNKGKKEAGLKKDKIVDEVKDDFKTKPEYLINRNIYYGKELGTELLNYEVFILPKSALGGVGINGIAFDVLNILGIERDTLEFSENDLEERKYKWFQKEINGKSIYLGFVVTKDKSKNKVDFTDQLINCIDSLKNYRDNNNLSFSKVNIFIPFLGAGEAGMDIMESLNIVKKGVKEISKILPNSKIRVNFPRRSNDEETSHYVNILNEDMNDTDSALKQPYNESDEFDSFEAKSSQIIEKAKDKIPFQLDQVVEDDKLGREPVAKAFVDLIKNDIFTDKMDHSFMVHLQGEWGAGKSSFLNFIKNNLNSGDENWIVVEYNAWQNQHINPPWWTLIDQVYRKSKEQLNWRACFHLWRKELFRRIWRYSGWEKIIAFLVFLLCAICIIYFGEDILNIFKESSEATNSSKETAKNSFTSNISDYAKLILTLSSIGGAIYAIAKFIATPFFISSSKEAESFVLKAADPMNKVKKHFNDLVDNINSKEKKRQLAIFIDDIDRCDREFIVKLLEGVQTLFKEKKVLYIVAGDKKWITTSFGNTYKEFTEGKSKTSELGEKFVEKAFQLSFRMPNVSDEAKKNYWNHILGIEKKEDSKRIDSVNDLDVELKSELDKELSSTDLNITDPIFMSDFADQHNLSADTVSNLVIEAKNKDSEEIRHLLQKYHSLIDSNPRSIIRLANNYTMIRSILIAEKRKYISSDKIFRWLVMEDLGLDFTKKIVSHKSTKEAWSKLESSISNKEIKESYKQLLLGDLNTDEEPIEMEDIKIIAGK